MPKNSLLLKRKCGIRLWSDFRSIISTYRGGTYEVSQPLTFCLTKNTQTKMQTILIFAVFQFSDISKRVIKSMGVLKKSKETATTQKT